MFSNSSDGFTPDVLLVMENERIIESFVMETSRIAETKQGWFLPEKFQKSKKSKH